MPARPACRRAPRKTSDVRRFVQRALILSAADTFCFLFVSELAKCLRNIEHSRLINWICELLSEPDAFCGIPAVIDGRKWWQITLPK